MKPFRKVYDYVITSGRWVTIREVCKSTGVSRPTATNILLFLADVKEVEYNRRYPASFLYITNNDKK